MDTNYLRECLWYRPETGDFFWKRRPSYHFKSDRVQKMFNTRFSGKLAGNTKSHGYQEIHVGGRRGQKIYLHRLAFLFMTGRWPNGLVDHINGDRADNRWCNLREVDVDGNAKNRSMLSTNTSGFNGVSYRGSNSTHVWRAQISSGGKNYDLGCYEDFKEAMRTRALAEIHFGFHRNHGKRMPKYSDD